MSTARTRILVLSLLVVTVVTGFALRTTMNVDAAQTEEGAFLLSGNDPYYHKHAVDHIVENWETLEFDGMLNFPIGSTNPNPPLYEWSVAVGSQVMEPFAASTSDAVWWSLLYSPAFWGTLTIIPAYLIGKELGGPWAGLLAGFLLATSPEHMSRSSLGFSDHDAINLFMITSGMYFLIRSLTHVGTPSARTRVRDLVDEIPRWFTEDRRAAGNAIVAGGFFGALALTWKGFPYVFGVLLAYAGFQFLVNHWRSKDIATPLLALSTTLGTASLVALPHYASFGLMRFWTPALFLLSALVVMGVFFLSVQRYPAVLVLPGLAVVGGIFAVFMFLVFPDIGAALFNRFVYFNQNRLYQTIAEARPASFSNLSFTVGPIPFFLSVVGVFWLAYRVWDTQRIAEFFFLIWVVVDLFMGVSAVRFLSLIVPSMAILAAATTVWLIRAMELPSLAEGYKMAGGGWRGLRRATGIMHILVILFVGLLVLAPNAFLAVDAAVPANYENTKISQARAAAFEDVTQVAHENGISGQNLTEIQRIVNQSRGPEDFSDQLSDARIRLGLAQSTIDELHAAGEDEMQTVGFYSQQFGAFGQSFLPDGWRGALNHLATLDQDEAPAERPAVVAWWDYGHWSIAVGEHPAVADNFQNGFRAAGNFLVAQNESHAIQIMGARYAPIMDEDTYLQTLTDHGISEFNATRLYDQFRANEYPYIPFAEDEDTAREISSDWLDDIEAATGKHIRYFAVDNRMLPVDDPRTQRVENPSIYYAPVTLAGKDPDAYVESSLVNQQTGEKMTEEELRELQRRSQQNQPQVGQQLFYKGPFFESMYYRGFVGVPAREPVSQGGQQFPIPFTIDQYPQVFDGEEQMLLAQSEEVSGLALTQEVGPGFGLRHFRLIYANDAVRVLQYYPGATIQGTVTVAGEPLEDVRVTVFDDAGDQVLRTNTGYFEGQDRTAEDLDIPHDSVVTGPDGTFELVAPFSQDRGIEIRVEETGSGGPSFPGQQQEGGLELANRTLQISQADAESGTVFTEDFQIEPANLTGVAFHDVDTDGERDPTEQVLGNVTVSLQGTNVTTGPDGRYTFEDLAPGEDTIAATADGYQVRSGQASVTLEPGNTTEKDLAFEYVPVQVNGTVVDPAGEVVEGVNARFSPVDENGTAREANQRSRVNGTISVSLQPGTYEVGGNGTNQATNTTLEIVRVEVTDGTGARVDEQGHLVIDPDAREVVVRLETERAS